MAHQTVFKRYELKYMITEEQKSRILSAMEPHMRLDKYGRTTIRNIYFDTSDYRIIRRSIEKPIFKEKLRIRSYNRAQDGDDVFVELKRKYDGVVYKRRCALPLSDAIDWISGAGPRPRDTQIAREIDYFIGFYGPLSPSVLLSYEREAFYEIGGGDFRVTFDDRILARREDISLSSDSYGSELLSPGLVLMELKCSGGIPLWMVDLLSGERIYKTSFSKYGTAYRDIISERTLSNNLINKELISNG